jgi:hypothetical protein
VNTDYTLAIGAEAEAVESKIMHRTFRDRAHWSGRSLVITRLHDAGDFELRLSRRIEISAAGVPPVAQPITPLYIYIYS